MHITGSPTKVEVTAGISATEVVTFAGTHDLRRAVLHITASGANCTVTVQASPDGTNWHDLAAYTAGVTGRQAELALCGEGYLRVSVANASTTVAQSVTAYLQTSPR